jgi:hypothetical protein
MKQDGGKQDKRAHIRMRTTWTRRRRDFDGGFCFCPSQFLNQKGGKAMSSLPRDDRRTEFDMDSRIKASLQGWFSEAGFLYVVVAVFVGLLFLAMEGWNQLSCNPTISRRATMDRGPGYYGRNPYP